MFQKAVRAELVEAQFFVAPLVTPKAALRQAQGERWSVNSSPGFAGNIELRYARPMPPLVSALMVTRGALSPTRFAVDCYQRQTHPNRELVIVCDAAAPELCAYLTTLADPSIRFITTDPAPLGELRNRAVAASAGSFVCQWDDDDLSAPSRIATQLKTLEEGDFGAVFLHRWLIWWPARLRLALSGRRTWEGSILARREALPAYPALPRSEDTAMVEQLAKDHPIGLLDRPDLYCYVIHGNNTWDAPHFEVQFAMATRRFEFADYLPALAQVAQTMPVDAYAAELDVR